MKTWTLIATGLAATLLTMPTMAASAANTIEVDWVANASEIVKNSDWKTMETITVELDEFHYSPDEFTFKVGQAYKLELIDVGEKKHYFTAPGFFKAIATRKVQANGMGEIKAPYFTALEVVVGGQLDLYFVPVKPGNYPVYCTINDHRDEGMEGSITITQ